MEKYKAIICNTPFHVLNAINIAANNIENCKGSIDIFLIPEFRNAKEIYEQLQDANIFKNTVLCQCVAEKKSPFTTMRRLISPQLVMNERAIPEKYRETDRYEKIFIADGNLVGSALHRLNKKAKIIFFEDGPGFYVGNSLVDPQSKVYKLVCGILKLGVYSYRVEKMYVNFLAICDSLICENKSQLPVLKQNNPAVDLAKQIFKYKNDNLYENHKFILLAQNLEELKGYNGKPFEMLYIPQYNVQFLLRWHPRQKKMYNSSIQCDDAYNMWELVCMNEITDEHVLISCSSTSVVSPKMIVDKEPYIIFTYKLFLHANAGTIIDECEQFVEKLRKEYRNRDKIYVPQSIEEYFKIIDYIIEADTAN